MKVEALGVPTPRGELDLRVAPGEVVLLRGPNGSGKTSLLRALAGLSTPLQPRHVRLDDNDPRALAADAMPARVAYSPQDPRDTHVGLTVEGEARLRSLALPDTLARLASRDSATLSSGESRRVAHALTPPAPLLLLDEPTEGLDAENVERLRGLVRATTARGGAVVLADHGEALADLATRVVELAPQPARVPVALPAAGASMVLRAAATSLRGRSLPALQLPSGFHVLTGANGSGKSSLLLRLAGILDATGVEVGGARPQPGRNVRLALPHARDALTRESVAEELAGLPPHEARALVPEQLQDRHPLTLSGGEAQRVHLAKCLGRPAQCYLLDEPEAHLDAEGRSLLLALVAARVAAGACVLAATHDVALQHLAHSRIEVAP